MSLREEQYKKVCRILDNVLANRPTERDSLIVAVRKAFESLEQFGNSEPLPSALPDNSLQKLADEIAKYKRTMRSSNSDYFTGYMSALSMVEGMIADMMPHEPYEGVRE